MSAPNPIPEWLLERYALDELPAAERERVRQALEASPIERERLAKLLASNDQILRELPPAIAVGEIRRRAGRQTATASRPARWTWMLAPAAVAAIALLAVFARPGTDTTRSIAPAPADGERVKGLEPHLSIYRVEAGRAVALGNGDPAHARDSLQLHYVAAGRRFGVVLSVDGRGSVTMHLPEAPASAPALSNTGEVALPHAYELDDAPRFERFILVTSDQPFAAEPILQAARALAAAPDAETRQLALPAGLSQSSLTLRKELP